MINFILTLFMIAFVIPLVLMLARYLCSRCEDMDNYQTDKHFREDIFNRKDDI